MGVFGEFDSDVSVNVCFIRGKFFFFSKQLLVFGFVHNFVKKHIHDLNVFLIRWKLKI